MPELWIKFLEKYMELSLLRLSNVIITFSKVVICKGDLKQELGAETEVKNIYGCLIKCLYSLKFSQMFPGRFESHPQTFCSLQQASGIILIGYLSSSFVELVHLHVQTCSPVFSIIPSTLSHSMILPRTYRIHCIESLNLTLFYL